VREGVLTEVSSTGEKNQYYMFLFNDMMLWTKVNSGVHLGVVFSSQPYDLNNKSIIIFALSNRLFVTTALNNTAVTIAVDHCGNILRSIFVGEEKDVPLGEDVLPVRAGDGAEEPW
jgi:hypothetical protein